MWRQNLAKLVKSSVGFYTSRPTAPPREHEALLAGPAGIRSEVLSLLEAHESAGSFLASPDAPDERKTIGPYRLLERIGEVGMGVDYRALRDDEALAATDAGSARVVELRCFGGLSRGTAGVMGDLSVLRDPALELGVRLTLPASAA